MANDDKRLRELCDLTSKEQDPERLNQFVEELNQQLESAEKRRLEHRKSSAARNSG